MTLMVLKGTISHNNMRVQIKRKRIAKSTKNEAIKAAKIQVQLNYDQGP